MEKYAVLSLSGGMDSSTLLLHLLNKGYNVTALSFDYGQKHRIELDRATELVEYINEQWGRKHPPFGAPYDYEFYPVNHEIIKLDGLSQLLHSTLVEGGEEVPEGHYASENMKDTVVPNRNKIFSSIVQSVALSIAQKHKEKCVMALGVHSGDHAIYPDCTEEFRQADLKAFKIGNWDSDLVDFYAPYMDTDKFGILQDGLECCKKLGLLFSDIYKRTNTSYKPIEHFVEVPIGNGVIEHKHKWFSDYKSASSVERIEAFIKLGIPDSVEYADETGPVSWEVAKKHVEQVLTEK
jgi:7-cyano-7-deazaguanine synthase